MCRTSRSIFISICGDFPRQTINIDCLKHGAIRESNNFIIWRYIKCGVAIVINLNISCISLAQIALTLEDALSLIKEAYLYAITKNPPAVDLEFINWLIHKKKETI